MILTHIISSGVTRGVVGLGSTCKRRKFRGGILSLTLKVQNQSIFIISVFYLNRFLIPGLDLHYEKVLSVLVIAQQYVHK